MSFVTYCNIWLKCYITFCDIVADGKRGFNVLARAIGKFNNDIKKNIKNSVYSFFGSFVNVMIASSSLMSTSQVSWSPFSKFNNFTKPIGTTVLKLPPLYDMILLNVTFIPPYLSVFTYIYIDSIIYKLWINIWFSLMKTLHTFI